MEQVRSFTVLGGMSGTSLDGLDLALCRFEQVIGERVTWRYQIEAAQTLPYPPSLENELRNAHDLPGHALIDLDRRYSRYLGEQARAFLDLHAAGRTPDLFVAHGHTVFHAPEQGYTYQLGVPSVVAVTGGCRVLADLRSSDLALGGQGAPLVPIGDRLLFSNYAACVNLGGFANLSMEQNGKRVAWDICPLNFVMNVFATRSDAAYRYDPDGSIARSGEVIHPLLEDLEKLPYYQAPGPKSLSREWVQTHVVPLLKDDYAPHHILRTWIEHSVQRITNDLSNCTGPILFTGGGAHNAYLIERLKHELGSRVTLGNKLLIDFKEALVFAFLGALYLTHSNNVLSSVTGAAQDHCAGTLHLPLPR